MAKEMDKFRVVLASKSPRRQQIFRENLGVAFEVVPSGFAEDWNKAEYAGKAAEYVSAYAVEKGKDVAARIGSRGQEGKIAVVVGCDTVVVDSTNKILEKPSSRAEAVAMLISFSNSQVEVVSGIAIFAAGELRFKGTCSTKVCFGVIDETLANAYAETGEPMDKAGAFGIQGFGAQLIRQIDGCYFNVVGLPVHMLASSLAEICKSL